MMRDVRKRYIAYYRVSTTRQGESGLGLDAQMDAVAKHIAPEQIFLAFTEIESGKKNDRPELKKALQACKQNDATLVVAKLDRLSRNVAFISALIESDVQFVCCDFPSANKFTLHLISAVAEYERDLISARTKAALAALKNRGVKLGAPGAHFTPKMREQAAKRRADQAAENENNRRALNYIKRLRQENLSWSQIARILNTEGFKTSRGREFQAVQVQRLFNRNNA